MKTLLFIPIFFLYFSVSGQTLSDEAKLLKNNIPNVYEPIKEVAVKEWGTDHSMVLHEINRQSKAFIDLMHIRKEPYDTLLMKDTLWEWRIEEDTEGDELKCDWAMALYEYKRQIKAKNAY